jgi:hypothetical protein
VSVVINVGGVGGGGGGGIVSGTPNYCGSVFADALNALVTHFAAVAGAFAQFCSALSKFMLMHCRTQQLAVASRMLDVWSFEAQV